MRKNLLCVLAAAAALAVVAPASATYVDVAFSPPDQSIDISAGTTTVDITATVSDGGGIIGWGLDLDLTGTSVSLLDSAVNEVDFDAVEAYDGDDLAALVPVGSLPDGQYTLATLTFSLVDLGVTTLDLNYTVSDPTEGFPLHQDAGGGFATATFNSGSIEVVPEPSVMALMVAGLSLLTWRRRGR